MTIFKLIYNFLFRTKRRSLTVKAFLLSAVAQWRVHFKKPQQLHKYMGIHDVESDTSDLPLELKKYAGWVKDKVARVAKRTPWESRCLVQAMVAERLLKSYGLSSTLYLGVGKNEEQKMVAHAWVRCGKYYICGGNGDGYATVAFFCYVAKEKKN